MNRPVFPPQWWDEDEHTVLSVVLDGVLFTFGIDIERSDRAELVATQNGCFRLWTGAAWHLGGGGFAGAQIER